MKKNIKKLQDAIQVIFGIIVLATPIVFGVTLLVCSFFKIVPGQDNIIAEIITEGIAYFGFPFGIIFTMLGITRVYEIICPEEFEDTEDTY